MSSSELEFSEDYQKFLRSCFGTSHGDFHNGVDHRSLLALEGIELEQAELRILDALPETRDSRPFIAAGILRLRSAVPHLQACIDEIPGENHSRKVWAAWALYRINRSQKAEQALLELLSSSSKDDDFFIYSSSISALADFDPSPNILSTLLNLVVNEQRPILLTSLIEQYFGARKVSEIDRILHPWVSEEMALIAGKAYRNIPEKERNSIEEGLLQRLEESSSPLIATILGLLNVKKAEPLLKTLVKSSDVVVRVRFAVALHSIEESPDAIGICIDALEGSEDQPARRRALDGLAQLPLSREGANTLLNTVQNDMDPYIRNWAFIALMAHFDDHPSFKMLHNKLYKGWNTGLEPRRLGSNEIAELRQVVDRRFNDH